MKKTLLSIAVIAASISLNAQLNITNVLTPHQSNVELVNPNLSKIAATSTLLPASFNTGGCATTPSNVVYYSVTQYTATPTFTADTKGFSFGTNLTNVTSATVSFTYSTGSRAAQKYTVSGTNITVTDVIFRSAISTSDAGTSMVSAKIYTENGVTKAPNVQVGVTATKALNALVGTDMLTFSTPVSIGAGSFFASIESPTLGGATNDTLAILSTRTGCSSADSLSWTYRSSGNTGLSTGWLSAKTLFGANLDILIFPVVNLTVGLNKISKNDLTLLAAFPNPTSNDITFNFGLNQASNVVIEIFDIAGKLVNTTNYDNLQIGDHAQKLDVSSLNNGIYMYSVKTENAKIFSKFTIAK